MAGNLSPYTGNLLLQKAYLYLGKGTKLWQNWPKIIIIIIAISSWYSPFKPKDPHTNSPDWSPYISFKNSWENLVKVQSFFPLVINWVILITFTFDDLLMLLGENWCWSLLGPKGLINKQRCLLHVCLHLTAFPLSLTEFKLTASTNS